MGTIKGCGGIILIHLKKIFTRIPYGLLEELDDIAESKKSSGSLFARKVYRFYTRKRLEKKYQNFYKVCSKEFAQIDVDFSEMCREIDNEQLNLYERQLGADDGIDG